MTSTLEDIPDAQKKQPWFLGRYHSPVVKQDLARLEDAATRRSAMHSLKSIVKQLDASSLPRFLDQLADIPLSSAARPFAISLYEEIAHIHAHWLTPHVPRFITTILRLLSASGSSAHLHSACAKAISAIITHCIHSRSTHLFEGTIEWICNPLMKVLSGKLEPLTAGAATCLRAVVEAKTWQLAPRNVCNELCFRVATAVGQRPTQTLAHLQLARSLVELSSSVMAAYSPLLLSSCSEILHQPSQWQRRAAAAQLVAAILRAVNIEAVASELPTIAKAMEKSRHDQMPGVRMAVMEALQVARSLLPQAYGVMDGEGGAKTKVLFPVQLLELPKSTSQMVRFWKKEALFPSPRKLFDPEHAISTLCSAPKGDSFYSSSSSSSCISKRAKLLPPLSTQVPVPTSNKILNQLLLAESLESSKTSSAMASDLAGVSQCAEPRLSFSDCKKESEPAAQLPSLKHRNTIDNESFSRLQTEVRGVNGVLETCNDHTPLESENSIHLKSIELMQKPADKKEKPINLNVDDYGHALSKWFNAYDTGIEGENNLVVDCREAIGSNDDDKNFARFTERLQSWKIISTEEKFLPSIPPDEVLHSAYLKEEMRVISLRVKLGSGQQALSSDDKGPTLKILGSEFNIEDLVRQDDSLQRNSHLQIRDEEFKRGDAIDAVESIVRSDAPYNSHAPLEVKFSLPQSPKFLIRAEDLLQHISPKSLQRLLQTHNDSLGGDAVERKHSGGSDMMSEVDLDASSETGWSVRDNPIAEAGDKEYTETSEGCTNHTLSELHSYKYSSVSTALGILMKDEFASFKNVDDHANQGGKISSINHAHNFNSSIFATLRPSREVLNTLESLKFLTVQRAQSTVRVENHELQFGVGHIIRRRATNIKTGICCEDNHYLLRRILEAFDWVEEKEVCIAEDGKPPHIELLQQNMLIHVYKWWCEKTGGSVQVLFQTSFLVAAAVIPMFIAIFKLFQFQDAHSSPVPT